MRQPQSSFLYNGGIPRIERELEFAISDELLHVRKIRRYDWRPVLALRRASNAGLRWMRQRRKLKAPIDPREGLASRSVPDRSEAKGVAEEKLKEINAAHDYLAIGPPVEERSLARRGARTGFQKQNRKTTDEPVFCSAGIGERGIPRTKTSSAALSTTDLCQQFSAQNFDRCRGGIAVMVFLWISTGCPCFRQIQRLNVSWEEFKTEVSRDVHANGMRIWGDAKEEPAWLAARKCASAGSAGCAKFRTRASFRSHGYSTECGKFVRASQGCGWGKALHHFRTDADWRF